MSRRNENNQINQTEFVEQAQFLEDRSTNLFRLKDLKQNKNLWPFYILVLLFFIIVALFLVQVFSQKQPEDETVNYQIEKDLQLDPLNQRVYELRESLKDHDPTKQSLPFPEVDLKFNIN
jgi:hypothetical protein